jgi:hypothetical protein
MEIAMNRPSNPLRAATMLMAASTLLLVACGHNSALDARATAPAKTNTQQSGPDPALNKLEAVTHHG